MALFIIPCVLIVLLLKMLVKIPSFVFRKMLHIIAFSCLTWMTYQAESWYAAALTSVLIAVVIYPILRLLESEKWYASFFVQKSKHEIRRSLLMLFLTYSAVVSVVWGFLQRVDICTASILMWGVGDAAAALVGIPFGKHKIHLPKTDGNKSWEGSIAMFLCSFIAGSTVFLIYGGFTVTNILLILLPAAVIGTGTELYSPSAIDTISVPIAISMIMLAGSILL